VKSVHTNRIGHAEQIKPRYRDLKKRFLYRFEPLGIAKDGF